MHRRALLSCTSLYSSVAETNMLIHSLSRNTTSSTCCSQETRCEFCIINLPLRESNLFTYFRLFTFPSLQHWASLRLGAAFQQTTRSSHGSPLGICSLSMGISPSSWSVRMSIQTCKPFIQRRTIHARSRRRIGAVRVIKRMIRMAAAASSPSNERQCEAGG